MDWEEKPVGATWICTAKWKEHRISSSLPSIIKLGRTGRKIGKAEGTHISGSVSHARIIRDLVSILLFIEVFTIKLLYHLYIKKNRRVKDPYLMRSLLERIGLKFDIDTRNCSQLANTKSQNVNVIIFLPFNFVYLYFQILACLFLMYLFIN